MLKSLTLDPLDAVKWVYPSFDCHSGCRVS